MIFRRLVIITLAVTLGAGCRHREAPMTAKLFRVLVPVTDIDRAAAFYGRVLGMEGTRVSNGRHYFDCEGTILACFSPRDDGDGYDPRPNPEELYLAVDDLEAVLKRCREAGAVFAPGEIHGDPAAGIATRPWGERSFYVEDPFGNKICFVDRETMFTGG